MNILTRRNFYEQSRLFANKGRQCIDSEKFMPRLKYLPGDEKFFGCTGAPDHDIPKPTPNLSTERLVTGVNL